MLSERLERAMKQAGVSQAELARACKVKPPSVHGWLNGKAKFMRAENLLAAAKRLKVSQDWLATGVGSMCPQLGSGTSISDAVAGQPDPNLMSGELSSEEVALVSDYRASTRQGRIAARAVLEALMQNKKIGTGSTSGSRAAC
jgi:transcriptional regulator with XRE-family HTH domain